MCENGAGLTPTMARKRKTVKSVSSMFRWCQPTRRGSKATATIGAHWRELGLTAPTIGDLVEAGEQLVPDFGALLQDLFLGLFKYNLVWLQARGGARSAVLNRTILEQLDTVAGLRDAQVAHAAGRGQGGDRRVGAR